MAAHNFPKAAEIVLPYLYVDNYISGTQTLEEAL
jgi:hypothetical protein